MILRGNFLILVCGGGGYCYDCDDCDDYDDYDECDDC